MLDPGCFSQRPSREPRWRHVLGADRGPGYKGPYSCLVIHRLWVYEKHTCLDAYMQSAALMFYIFTFSLIFPPLQECLQGGYTRHQPVPSSPLDAEQPGGDEHVYQAVLTPRELKHDSDLSWCLLCAGNDAAKISLSLLWFNALHTPKPWAPRGYLMKEHVWNKNVRNRHWAWGQLMKENAGACPVVIFEVALALFWLFYFSFLHCPWTLVLCSFGRRGCLFGYFFDNKEAAKIEYYIKINGFRFLSYQKKKEQQLHRLLCIYATREIAFSKCCLVGFLMSFKKCIFQMVLLF